MAAQPSRDIDRAKLANQKKSRPLRLRRIFIALGVLIVVGGYLWIQGFWPLRIGKYLLKQSQCHHQPYIGEYEGAGGYRLWGPDFQDTSPYDAFDPWPQQYFCTEQQAGDHGYSR